MKASLRTKALVLSLSALVIVGSGCERRGRAPVKSSGSGPTSVVADPNQKSAPIVPKTETPVVDRETDLSKSKESDLEVDARMDCSVAAIDELGTPSAESFTSDLVVVKDYRRCIANYGIELTESAEKPLAWTLDISKANGEFIKIAKEPNSDDDIAYKVMASRLELSILNFRKMITKYGEGKLGVETLTDSAQKVISVENTLSSIKEAISTLEAGRKDVKEMKTIVDGADITEPGDESDAS